MRTVERRHVEPADLRIAQVLDGRLLRAIQELSTVEDLKDAAVERTVSDVEPIALHAGRDWTVQVRRHRAGCAGLMARQPEIADLHRLRWIGEVVDLEHAVPAPARHARHEESNASVAFPPALVRILVVAADTGDELG